MNETIKRLGTELRRRFSGELRRPLSWRIIDALVSIEEADEARVAARCAGSSDDSATPKGAADGTDTQSK